MKIIQVNKRDFSRLSLKIGFILFPFTLALPLPLKINAISLIILLVLLLFSLDLKSLKMRDSFLVVSVFFFLIDALLPILFFDINRVSLNDTKIAYFVVPFLFFNSKNLLNRYFILFLHSFVFGVIVYVFYSWIYVFYFYNFLHPDWYSFSLTDGYIFYILYNYLPGVIHHTYIGLYIITAINILLLYPLKNRLLTFILIFILCFTVFYIGSKIVSVLLFFNFLIFFVKNKVNFKILLIFTCFCFISLYFIKDWLFYNLANSIADRIDYYNCGSRLLKNSFWRGYGYGNIKSLADSCSNLELNIFIPHNSFLYAILSNGVLGLLLLLTFCFILFRNSIRKRNIVFILLVVNIIIISFVEDIFYLQKGVLFIISFVSLFTYSSRSFKKTN